MTKKEFIEVLKRVLPYYDGMVASNVFHADIAKAAAVELFTRGEFDSRDALAIREQLQHLKNPGCFNFSD